MLGWYVALGLLLLVPPPREWWPLCGAAIFGALGTIGIVLVMEHPLFYDAARFWKPTFPVVVMTVLGLTGSHGLRLLDSRPWKLHLQSAVVVALLFIAMVATTKRQPDLEQGLRKQVVRFEQGIRLYTHFVRSEPHAGPVVMIDSSDLFDWLSIEGVLGGSRPNSRKRYHLEGLLGGQWREEPFSCDADGVYYVVTEEKRDLASECDRCTPYSPVGVVPAQARPRRPQTRWFREPPLPNHALAFYPWAIWHCR